MSHVLLEFQVSQVSLISHLDWFHRSHYIVSLVTLIPQVLHVSLSGLPGPIGLKGLTSLRGLTGVTCLNGLTCLTGLTGPTGLEGLTNLSGLKGFMGLAGPEGITLS